MELKSLIRRSAGELTAEDGLWAAQRSEFAYFRAAARVETGPDWFVAQMPGLEHIPSASFGFWEPACDDIAAVPAAVAAIEAAFERLEARHTRIYTNDAPPLLADHLSHKGYRSRKESIALKPTYEPVLTEPALELCEVTSETDWADKRALHESSERLSDGHKARAEDWVALERRKAETGDVTFYLVKQAGDVVATAGLMRPLAGAIRIKNLFVSADHRQRGIGQAVLGALSRRAHQDHRCCPVVYFVEGPIGRRLYGSVGFQPIGSVFEWMR